MVLPPLILPNINASLGRGGFNSASIAIFNAFTTPPTAARKILINNCVTTLVNAGVWAQLDVLYFFAAADSQAARINWRNTATFTAVATNSPTFVTDRGFSGDAVSSFVDSTYTPSTAGGNLTQNSAHYSGWSLTQLGAAAGNQRILGNNGTTTPRCFIVPRNTGDAATFLVNDGTTLSIANTVTNTHFLVNRSASNARQAYKAGALLTSSSQASTGLPTQSVTFDRDSTAQFGSLQIAMGSIGASLNATQVGALYSAALAYLQGVGAA